jgi:hypothetical protein
VSLTIAFHALMFILFFSYRRNEADALKNKETKASFAIDGMDNQKCHVPHFGDQGSFTPPLKQHVQGILEHGYGQYNTTIFFLR